MKVVLCERCGEYRDCSDGEMIPIRNHDALVCAECATDAERTAYWGHP